MGTKNGKKILTYQKIYHGKSLKLEVEFFPSWGELARMDF